MSESDPTAASQSAPLADDRWIMLAAQKVGQIAQLTKEIGQAEATAAAHKGTREKLAAELGDIKRKIAAAAPWEEPAKK